MFLSDLISISIVEVLYILPIRRVSFRCHEYFVMSMSVVASKGLFYFSRILDVLHNGTPAVSINIY